MADLVLDDHGIEVLRKSGKKATSGDVYLRTSNIDAAGNEIGSHESVDGDYHQSVAMIQAVYADPNNSSTTNLTSDNTYTFTGTKTSTLGVVALQWSLKTTQNATVCIDQSPDGTNWDITDCFDYIEAKGGDGGTVQAVNSYWRIRVILTTTANTTSFRLQGILCPIAEPLPRSLSGDGRLKSESTISGRENTSRHVWVNPTNELAVSPVYRLVGTAFDGTSLDSNFWEPTLVNGSITQAGGAISLKTSAAINSSAKYVSVRSGRFVAGSAQLFTCGVGTVVDGVAGNTRRVGAYNTNNGYYFELVGTTFSLGTRKAGSDTLILGADFNGNLGANWEPSYLNYYKLDIEITPLSVSWYVNGVRLHTKTAPLLSDTLTLPITIENINTTNSTDIEFLCVGAYIARQGELVTSPTSKYQNGVTAEIICKRGAGVLKGAVIGGVVAGSIITIYDGDVATGSTIWASGAMEKKTNPYELNFYDLPFSIGLSFAITIQASNFLVIYE